MIVVLAVVALVVSVLSLFYAGQVNDRVKELEAEVIQRSHPGHSCPCEPDM